jgi:hypothetical protein
MGANIPILRLSGVYKMFSFFKRKAKEISLEEKTKSITPLPDQTTKYQSDPPLIDKMEITQEEKNKEQEQIPEGLFDPRDQGTWSFASNRPLVIDGVRIFKTRIDASGKELKEDETEKGFVRLLSVLLEAQKKNIVQEEAVKLVKPDFTFEGKEPTKETPGYTERVNEVYQSILKNPAVRLTKEQEREYINDHIQSRIDQSSKAPEDRGDHEFPENQSRIVAEYRENMAQKEQSELKQAVAAGEKIETSIIKRCSEYYPDNNLFNKLPDSYINTNILIDHIIESQGILLLSKSELINLFTYKLSQFTELAYKNKLPIQEMNDYYKENNSLISDGIDEDEAHDKLSDAFDKIFSDENEEKFNEIIEILNKDIISVPLSEVFMLDQINIITNRDQWNRTAIYLENELLKYSFDEPYRFPVKDYDVSFYQTIKSIWKDTDTDILRKICLNYTQSRYAACHFFFNMFLEDGRLKTIKDNMPGTWIEDHRSYLPYATDAWIFDNAFDHFSKVVVYENDIKYGAIVKKCKKSGVFYIEKIHIAHTSQYNLYCPYYKMTNNNNILNDKVLLQLLDYSKMLGKCPNINELDNPRPSISITKSLLDLWVAMPNSSFYKDNFGSIRNAYKVAKQTVP